MRQVELSRTGVIRISRRFAERLDTEQSDAIRPEPPFRRRQQMCAHAVAVVTSVYRNDVYLGTPREMAIDREEADEFVLMVNRKRWQYFGIMGETEQGLFYAEPLRKGPQYGLALRRPTRRSGPSMNVSSGRITL